MVDTEEMEAPKFLVEEGDRSAGSFRNDRPRSSLWRVASAFVVIFSRSDIS